MGLAIDECEGDRANEQGSGWASHSRTIFRPGRRDLDSLSTTMEQILNSRTIIVRFECNKCPERL